MDQTWFEMLEERRRKLANAVWIPLRSIHRIGEVGLQGHVGYKTEFYGVGSLAVPISHRHEAEKLGWHDVGIRHNHTGYFEKDDYFPADIYQDHWGKWSGLYLVLDQHTNSAESNVWHLHQDFVVTLGLKREDNVWVRPDEGYIEVARLLTKGNCSPYLLEVRASHLRDYLCARKMALYITSYRERVEVLENACEFTWNENKSQEINGNDQWEGRIVTIHEGGMPYGGKTAYFHVARTDADPEEDVPVFGLPSNGNTKSNSSILEHKGKRLYKVAGEFWRNEWVEPADQSPIVRGDKVSSSVFFITDAEGKKERAALLLFLKGVGYGFGQR